MGSVGLQFAGLQSLFKHISCRMLGIGGIRTYSVFHPHHIKPTFRKDEQERLEQSGELAKIAHMPILPPMKAETCSEFFDPVVDKFINYVLRRGKKELARSLVEETFEKIKRIQLERYHKAKPEERVNIVLNPKEILHTAVINCTPVMELMPMKKGGSTYRVPIPVLERRQRFLSMNWIIQAAQDKEGSIPFSTQLAKELIDAAHNQGRVVKKKQDLHKQCEANRAYAHFRWSG
ncbi:28S ribosomal protein S7, mitochondrial [Fopius arisanus]|uniref:28S ribosomal protein S7, mitochondrial n=1 Tax=Fopius arisanus TaxID=64838 RepID=A0A9R1TFZ5_9HYME|nr:PREDICTED: 28S ribosomal protein S7, mitochondrial [Fopius arisanus]